MVSLLRPFRTLRVSKTTASTYAQLSNISNGEFPKIEIDLQDGLMITSLRNTVGRRIADL